MADAIVSRVHMPKERMRMIANGRELGMGEALSSLGEFWFMSNAIILREVDESACREWQRVGRCNQGRNCDKCSTHVMAHSPRYVAYNNTPDTTPVCPVVPPTKIVSAPPQHEPTKKPTTPPAWQAKREQQKRQAPRLCRNWTQHGSCHFDQRCHFKESHTYENLPSNMRVSQAEANQYNAHTRPEFSHSEFTQPFASPVLLSGPEPAQSQMPPTHYSTHQHYSSPQVDPSHQGYHQGSSINHHQYHQGYHQQSSVPITVGGRDRRS